MNRNIHAFCAALLAFVLILVICLDFIESRKFSVAEEIKTVYLTFDDGPSDRVTPKILDVLKEENVKATFFIIGQNAERRKYLLQRELDEGHTVAVHSYSHEYKSIYSSPQSLIRDIDKCNEIISSVSGQKSTLYRFPGGSYGLSDRIKTAVKQHGMKYIDWNASLRDAEIENASPQTLYECAVESSKGLDNIVLLAHDSTTKLSTAAVLKNIIKYYKAQNYKFNTF